MIISASRRTDIPACYAPWLARRLQEGYVLVRNPYNTRMLSRVPLSPDVVDGMVLWTKNFTPMLPYLDAIGDIPYYVQYTVTPYGKDIEPGLPEDKIAAFLQTAERIGWERIVWRYDPIILTNQYTVEWHIAQFSRMAEVMAPSCRRCVISFVNMYRSTGRNMAGMQMKTITQQDMRAIAKAFSGIAADCNLPLATCCETIDLAEYGIEHNACIDRGILEELAGCPLNLQRAKGQREACGCMQSTDIGLYGTCTNGCRYCYANDSAAAARKLAAQHDPHSPLLAGTVRPDDIIHPMKAATCRENQLRMF